MDEQQAKKILDEAEALAEAGDVDGAKKVFQEAFAEAEQEGLTMQSSQLESIASYVQKSVETALDEILAVATAMNSKVIPVEFVKHVRTLPATGVMQLWHTVEDLGVPMNFGEVPDDLSELDGL